MLMIDEMRKQNIKNRDNTFLPHQHTVPSPTHTSSLTLLLSPSPRLPIIQGGTFSFLVPTIAILITTFEACSDLPLADMTTEEREEVWQVRMREIQGAIAVSAIFQVLVGFTGKLDLFGSCCGSSDSSCSSGSLD